MRFLIVLALCSIPLVYANIGNAGGIAYLMNMQRMAEFEKRNQKPADMFAHATIPAGVQVDDDLDFVSSASAVPVPDPMDAFANPAAGIFAHVKMADNAPRNSLRTEAAVEDNEASRFFTGTSSAKNPAEVIEDQFARSAGGVSPNMLGRAKVTKEKALAIF